MNAAPESFKRRSLVHRELSALGASFAELAGAAVAIDIGGASTEVMIGLDGKIGKFWSLSTGVVLLTEKHLRSDPPSERNLRDLAGDIARRLDKIHRYRGKADFVAIGGTAATMVSMMLKLSRISGKRIHGRRVTLDSIGRTMDLLTAIPLVERRKVKGLDPDRADIILSGLAFLIGAANHFGVDTVTASARGLRQGLLL